MPRNLQTDFLRAVLNAIPSPVLVVDDDVRIIHFNTTAANLLGKARSAVLRRRGGEALGYIHSTETPGGCGAAPACQNCIVRNSVRASFDGKHVYRKSETMQLVANGQTANVHLLVTTAPIEFNNQHFVLLVLEDVSELMSLRRIVPMCAGCRKVRDDQEYWQQVDLYFKRHLNIDVSHGICPDCAARLYPELSEPHTPE